MCVYYIYNYSTMMNATKQEIPPVPPPNKSR